MKQILYASVSARADGKAADIDGILQMSRHNNALDGIRGLLWTDGYRFLQVIEGDDDAIDACYARIRADDRHTAITTLIERPIDERQFGYWTLAHRRSDELADEHDWHVRRMLADVAPDVAEPFLALVSMREAA